MKVFFLESDRVPNLHKQISAQGERFGLRNIFNVGLLAEGDAFHCVFRALPQGGSKPFRSYYVRLSEQGAVPSDLVDLSMHARELGVPSVADPKLFSVDGRIYVTFNTGQPASGDANAIYVMQVSPDVGPPQLCRLLGARKPVEKNWAFTGTSAGLAGLYEISPLTTLRQVDGELGNADLTFEVRNAVQRSGLPGVALSIGTQIISHHGELLFVCHEKVGFRSRRAYFGRLCKVSFEDGVFSGLKVSGVRLLHSFRRALPHRPVHNPSLISATYFSGLSTSGDDLLLSYGINDVDFSVARVRKELLWQ